MERVQESSEPHCKADRHLEVVVWAHALKGETRDHVNTLILKELFPLTGHLKTRAALPSSVCPFACRQIYKEKCSTHEFMTQHADPGEEARVACLQFTGNTCSSRAL